MKATVQDFYRIVNFYACLYTYEYYQLIFY